MCDRISDTLLDFHLNQDPNSRCAIEVCGGNGKVFVTGEVTSNTKVTEDDIKNIVYIISGVEDVIIHLNQQSPEIFKELILVERRPRNYDWLYFVEITNNSYHKNIIYQENLINLYLINILTMVKHK